MSAPQTVQVRPGVVFIPDAAAAFQRAEAQLGRRIDVNSTYRDWDRQLAMHHAWIKFANGNGPKPPHSRAVHPRYSDHTLGIGLDSDDWTNAKALEVLADNGFIRTHADDPTERHHFQYQRQRDKHHGKPLAASAPINTTTEDDMQTAVLERAADSNATKSLYDLRTGRAIRAISKAENTAFRANPTVIYVPVDDAEYRSRGGL